jgi:hypothetical protein
MTLLGGANFDPSDDIFLNKRYRHLLENISCQISEL